MAGAYRGTAGGVDINTETIAGGINYGVGFGGGDFRRALEEGYSASSVLDYLNSWNNPVAPNVRTQLQIMAQGEQQLEQAQQAQQLAFEQSQNLIREQRRIAEEQMRQQQRQLQISTANQGMAGSGQVQFSQPKADRKKLTSAGTTGYFGRQGLRIKGLNVAPVIPTTSAAGSFA